MNLIWIFCFIFLCGSLVHFLINLLFWGPVYGESTGVDGYVLILVLVGILFKLFIRKGGKLNG